MKSPSGVERLVLGCMDSYDSEPRFIFQGFWRSIRCTPLESKWKKHSGLEISLEIVKKIAGFSMNSWGLSGAKEC